MSKEIKGNGKHLTLDDRSTLQAGLDQKKSFRAIAKELHKDPSTLAKEVKLNRTGYGRCSYTSSLEGLCKYTRLCKKTNLCHGRTKCKASPCCKCRIHDCRRICPDFVKKPEHALKLFVRFAIAKGAITYGMELMLALFNIVQGTISTIMGSAGFSTLAFGYVLPTTGRTPDLNRLETCAAGRTRSSRRR